MTGATRLKVYDKGLHLDGVANQVARVEMTEQFKKPRPAISAFLRGDLVDGNGLSKVKVIDLAAVGTTDLTKLALEVGLTEAIRIGLPAQESALGRLKYPNMATLRRKVNANVVKDLLFKLYQDQALPWHQQFDLTAASNLAVIWRDDVGIQIIF